MVNIELTSMQLSEGQRNNIDVNTVLPPIL